MKKRLSALILCVVLILSVIPVLGAESVELSDIFDINITSRFYGNGVRATATIENKEQTLNTDIHKMILVGAFYNKDGLLLATEISESKTFKMEENTLKVNLDIPSIPTGAVTAKFFAVNNLNDLKPLCPAHEMWVSKSIKILAIGNSFSIDSMRFLYDVLDNAGYTDITLGNLYIAGCSIDTHYNNIVNKTAGYTYYKNTTGVWIEKANHTSNDAIVEEDWDFISMQQKSSDSPQSSTFSNLENLLTEVKKLATNENVKYIWNMTWAYHNNYNFDTSIAGANKNQIGMYTKITEVVKSNILTNNNFSKVIPTGTTIQNLRGSSIPTEYVQTDYTRDGSHLAAIYGRFPAALTWFTIITGVDVDVVTYYPAKEVLSNVEYTMEPGHLYTMKEAVKAAVKKPFELSSLTPPPVLTIDTILTDYDDCIIRYTMKAK